MRVGVARRVEPRHRHALSVVRRLQERVDAPFVRVGRAIGEKRVEFGRRRRQAGEVVGDPSQQRRLVGLWRRLEPLTFQPREDESIDRIPHPVVLGDRWRIGTDRRRVGPMRVPVGAFVNPSSQQLDLARRQRVTRVRRRHVLLRVGIGDALTRHTAGHSRARCAKSSAKAPSCRSGTPSRPSRRAVARSINSRDGPDVAQLKLIGGAAAPPPASILSWRQIKTRPSSAGASAHAWTRPIPHAVSVYSARVSIFALMSQSPAHFRRPSGTFDLDRLARLVQQR